MSIHCKTLTPADVADLAAFIPNPIEFPAAPGTQLMVAYWEAEPAGLAIVVRTPKFDIRRGFLFVDELLVLPMFRRRGVARALLQYVEAQANAQGLAGVRLLVRPENAAARALYAAAGYAEMPTYFCEKIR